MPVGRLAEAPGQLAADLEGTDRIAERDPAAASHAVHHEARAPLVEEQAFVAEQREECNRARRSAHDRERALELGVGRWLELGRRRAQQTREREHAEQYGAAQQRAQ
jgi:hypothetical protein